MAQPKSLHDAERDRIVSNWSKLCPFTCAACQDKTEFRHTTDVRAEFQYEGRLRADVAAIDDTGSVVGVVEVVYSHAPTEQALAAQSALDFAYYRWLRTSNQASPDVWLCSTDCWKWYVGLGGMPTSSYWDAPRCDGCNKYFYENRLSWFQFRDWSDDPHSAYCIHCAAAVRDAQWRSPGELVFGDPREWTPDDDTDPAGLLMAYSEASFWSMVWSNRVAKLGEPDTYLGKNDRSAEDATARRLALIFDAFDAGDWGTGANLLLPVGAPGWAEYPGEPERLLAFRPDNCRGTTTAWHRLEQHRLEQLPDELASIVRQSSDVPV